MREILDDHGWIDGRLDGGPISRLGAMKNKVSRPTQLQAEEPTALEIRLAHAGLVPEAFNRLHYESDALTARGVCRHRGKRPVGTGVPGIEN